MPTAKEVDPTGTPVGHDDDEVTNSKENEKVADSTTTTPSSESAITSTSTTSTTASTSASAAVTATSTPNENRPESITNNNNENTQSELKEDDTSDTNSFKTADDDADDDGSGEDNDNTNLVHQINEGNHQTLNETANPRINETATSTTSAAAETTATAMEVEKEITIDLENVGDTDKNVLEILEISDDEDNTNANDGKDDKQKDNDDKDDEVQIIEKTTSAATTAPATTSPPATTEKEGPGDNHAPHFEPYDPDDDDELDELDNDLEDDEEIYNDSDDDNNDDEDDDDDNNNLDTTFVSVYSTEEVSSTTTTRTSKKRSATNMTKSSSSTPATSSITKKKRTNPKYYALRKGRTTQNCIYFYKKDLKLQINDDFYQPEYKSFDELDDAVEYILSEPLLRFKTRNIDDDDDDDTIAAATIAVAASGTTTATDTSGDQNKDDDNDNGTKEGPPTKRAKNDEPEQEISWESMYIQLQQYFFTHGNLEIPGQKKYAHLRNWIIKQREEYRYSINGVKNSMTEGRIQLLLALNFQFINPATNQRKTFDELCQELVDYKEMNVSDPKSTSFLYGWIMRMKYKYKDYLAGKVDKSGGMDIDKVYALELIGFPWTRDPSTICKKNGKKFTPSKKYVPVESTDKEATSKALAASLKSYTAADFAKRATGLLNTSNSNGMGVNNTFMTNAPVSAHNSPFMSTTSSNNGTPNRTIPIAPYPGSMQVGPYMNMPAYAPGYFYLPPPTLTPGAKSATTGNNNTPNSSSVTSQTLSYSTYFGEKNIRERHWKEQFADLKKFKEDNGHLNLSFADDDRYKKLKNWCRTQRTNYRLLTRGKPCFLTESKKKMLDEIGFEFECGAGLREAKWKEAYNELKNFKEKHGSLKDVVNDKDLNHWCNCQRRQYRKFKLGKESAFFNEDKLKLLEAIGFDFDLVTATPRTSKLRDKWFEKFEELKKYKFDHGDFDPPIKSKLYAWTSDQKLRLKKYQAAKEADNFSPDRWAEEKIEKLVGIGFDFMKRRKSKLTPRKILTEEEKNIAFEEWTKMYTLLKSFKEENGHCVPPARPITPLRTWMEKQRVDYKKYIAKKESSMTGLKISFLNEIDFPFTSTVVKIPWEERYAELKRFKAKYGNTMVPQGYTGQLGMWTQRQRNKYKDYKAGKKTSMTEERVKLLEELGMVWQILPTPKVSEKKTWNQRFEDLLAYKEEHGHMRVPQSVLGLGSWVHRQRVDYQLMKKGRKSPMNTEKALRLTEGGFEFIVNPKKQRDRPVNLYDPHPHVARKAAEGENNDDNDDEEGDEMDEDEEVEGEDEVEEELQELAYYIHT